MKAHTDKFSWSIDGPFHILAAEGNLVLEPKLTVF